MQVYKALRHGVQIVAVKMFKEEMTRGAINSLTSPHHAMQFRREISILKSCHDKNIVQFLGACLTVRPPLGCSGRRHAGSRHSTNPLCSILRAGVESLLSARPCTAPALLGRGKS